MLVGFSVTVDQYFFSMGLILSIVELELAVLSSGLETSSILQY